MAADILPDLAMAASVWVLSMVAICRLVRR